MHVVIPLINNFTKHDELRYALRSLEQYIPHDKVFVIGHKPVWLKNVVHIPYNDIPQTRYKERNLYNKIVIACKDERVSDNFIYFHDDHFILPDFDITQYYACKTFEGRGNYHFTIANTRSAVQTGWNYDVHCPMVINKEKFKALSDFNWSVQHGYMIKTMYCALNKIPPAPSLDIKLRRPMRTEEIRDTIEGTTFFSTDNSAIRSGGLLGVLKSLYQNPSKYE